MSASLSSIFKSLITLILFTCICLLVACSGSSKQPQDLLVASASDLSTALPELAKDFEGRSGVHVVPSFGPSGQLAQQIAHGAPYDVFLSADRRFVAQLADSGHLDSSSRRIYALGKLVMYASGVRMAAVEDLRRSEIQRISIANPGIAPYGRAAKQALERAGVWVELQNKIVIAENVRQALQMVESGNVDVAITALSLIGKGSEHTINVPLKLYDPIEQEGGAVIRPSAHPRSRDFLDYLGSAGGKAILSKYGFTLQKILK